MAQSTCSVEGCEKRANARGLCSTHYGKSDFRPRCSVDGCAKPAHAKSYCAMHYERWRRLGDALAVARPWVKRLEPLPHGHDLSAEELRLRHRSRILVATYGITHEEFLALAAAQDGRCALCGEPPSNRSRGDRWLHVDHDHLTGRVRGLLCLPCNTTIGAAEKLGLERIAQYLRSG